jgi:hypothetical protein
MFRLVGGAGREFKIPLLNFSKTPLIQRLEKIYSAETILNLENRRDHKFKGKFSNLN